jgi:kynurenine formamidase
MGLPAPIICDYLSKEQSKQNFDSDTSFQIGKIEMVTNTGTYIDCPFHRFADGRTRPVHTVLLGAGILIVEHLCNLNKLPAENFTFTAAPPKFKGVGTFPVRAFASVEKK